MPSIRNDQSTSEIDKRLPKLVSDQLNAVLTPDERKRIKVTTRFVKGYEPFTVAARGRMYSLVFLAADSFIHWGLTTRFVGRVNLTPDPDILHELKLFMRVVNVLIEDPLYRMMPDMWELRS